MLSEKDLYKLNQQEKNLIYIFSVVLTLFSVLSLIKDFYFQSIFLIVLDLVCFVSSLYLLFVIRVKNKVSPFNLIFASSILFSIVLFFYMIYLRMNLIVLFFFPKLFAVGSFLNFKPDFKKLIVVLLFDLVLIVLYFATDIHISGNLITNQDFILFSTLIYVIFFIALTILGIFIIYKKTELLFHFHSLYQQTFEIVDDNDFNDNIDIDHQNEIKDLIKSDYSLFYDKFKEYYPVFVSKIEKLYSNFVLEEMKVIALLYLNYSTKEISTITDSTLRSIESKKYRIRKKLHISSDKDINMFLHNL
jgi:hypothetical protein